MSDKKDKKRMTYREGNLFQLKLTLLFYGILFLVGFCSIGYFLAGRFF